MVLGVRLGWLFRLLPVVARSVTLIGIAIDPLLLRPFYRRAEEYQLLVTFGLLQILEDLIRFVWGGTPLSADTMMDALPILRIGGLLYPAYNLVVVAVGALAAPVFWAGSCPTPSS